MILFNMDDGTLLLAEEADIQTDPLRVNLGLAVVVRHWGTTRGRGQLALEGPTDKTVVDVEPPGGVVNWLHVRRAIPVVEAAKKKWLAYLSGKN